MQKLNLVVAVSIIGFALSDMSNARAADCAEALTEDSSWGVVVSCLQETATELKELKSQRAAAAPSGVVVASTIECGQLEGDWSPFDEGAGRMIIGAGQPGSKLDAEFVSRYGKFEVFDPKTKKNIWVYLRPYERDAEGNWLYYESMEVGGAEQVTLAEPQMPKHSHRGHNIRTSGGQGNTNNLHPWVTSARDQLVEAVEKTGENQSHNNMPPYIALYFCKKDGPS